MRKLFLLLIFICLGFLTACSGEKQISGEVIERNTNDDASIISFIIETDKGERIGILMTDETYIMPWVDGITADDFRFSDRDGIIVSVSHKNAAQAMTTKDGETISAYNAREIEITAVRTRRAVTLSDGAYVDLWQQNDSSLCQADIRNPLRYFLITSCCFAACQ